MALRDLPHVKRVRTFLRVEFGSKPQHVTHVETDLHLDPKHPDYDKAAIEKIFAEAEKSVKAPADYLPILEMVGVDETQK